MNGVSANGASSEVKDAVSVVRNRRTDAMFVAAYLAVCALVYIVVYESKIGEFAQGIVTLVLGMFLNELKNMYSYETGTTRSAQTKDATIKGMVDSTMEIAKEAPKDVARAVAASRAPAPTEPIVPAAPPAAQPAVTPAAMNPETGVIPAAEVQQQPEKGST